MSFSKVIVIGAFIAMTAPSFAELQGDNVKVARGTLVLMVPTSAGLIIGADSRNTLMGQNGAQVYCDNYYKITEIDRFDRMAFIVTGHASVWDLSKAKYLRDVCAEGRVIFDAAVLVKEAFDKGEVSPANILERLPEICVRGVKLFLETNTTFEARRGKQLFQIAVGSYDDAQQVSRVQSFSIDMSNDGIVSAGDFKSQQFNPDQDWSLILFGEASFLEQQVFRGVGIQYLTEKYGRFRSGPTRIRDTDPTLAADFVAELIEAAGRTTSLIPSATGIGGPTDIVLLGKPSRPQKIIWK